MDAVLIQCDSICRWGITLLEPKVFGCSSVSGAFSMCADSIICNGDLSTKTYCPMLKCSVCRTLLSKSVVAAGLHIRKICVNLVV